MAKLLLFPVRRPITAQSQEIQPSISASWTQGFAPLGVTFDASATTADATTRPYHELWYVWDFGDPGSGTWSTTGRSRNEAFVPTAAHVYETPGTYTVTLTVFDANGNSSSTTTTITVDDPDVVFGSAGTVVVAQDGDFTGAPDADTQVTTSDFSVAWAEVGSNKRVLFKRGETWSTNVGVARTLLGVSVGVLGAWGTGANPVFQRGAAHNNWISFGDLHDWRFQDWEVDSGILSGGPFTGQTDPPQDTQFRSGFGQFNGQSTKIVFSRVVATRFDHWILAFYLNDPGGIDNRYENVHLYECTAERDDSFDGDWCVFYEGLHSSMMGCRLDGGGTAHPYRSGGFKDYYMGHTRITGQSDSQNVWKFHSWSWNGFQHNVIQEFTERVCVEFSRFISDNIIASVQVAPENVNEDQRFRNIIFQSNYFEADNNTSNLKGGVEDWTIRNNIFNGVSVDQHIAITITRRGKEPAFTRQHIYNNTIYGNVETTFDYVNLNNLDSTVTVVVRNNLVWNVGDPSTPVIAGTGSFDGTLIESDNWKGGSGADPQLTNATPGRDPNFDINDYNLLAGSPALDIGADIASVIRDYLQVNRPAGAYDAGALERT